MSLGLCMIVKNESAVLARALDSVKDVVDEIVIVDTGSTDDTVEIARRYTDKVFGFDWINDFAAARNYALSLVTSDYWMWLDADDVVPPQTAKAIPRLLSGKTAPPPDIIMLPYVLGVDGNGKPTFSYYRERIIKNRPDYFWRGYVHEAVSLHGNVVYVNKPIMHVKPPYRTSGTRNLDIYRTMLASGKTLEPRERYYFARELYYNGYITEAAVEFEAFLEMPDGFSVNKVDACILLSHCYKQLGSPKLALQAALYSFNYGVPCGESCCAVGSLFLEQNDVECAAYWFERALHSKPNAKSGAFCQTEYHGFIPLMWLTVCYDRLGKTKKAFGYHRRAQKLRPDDRCVLANEKYFASRGFTVTCP